MKEIFTPFKPFLFFLLRFFVVYIGLLVLYNFYLSQYNSQKNELDGITTMVSHQAVGVLQVFDTSAHLEKNVTEPSMNVFYHQKWVARVIEGCNAVSIAILFLSFIIAFTGTIKKTFFFGVFGIFLLHVFNVLRIAFLVIGMYHYPEYKHVLHSVFFPIIIYGFIFFMWVIWVNKFSNHAKTV